MIFAMHIKCELALVDVDKCFMHSCVLRLISYIYIYYKLHNYNIHVHILQFYFSHVQCKIMNFKIILLIILHFYILICVTFVYISFYGFQHMCLLALFININYAIHL